MSRPRLSVAVDFIDIETVQMESIADSSNGFRVGRHQDKLGHGIQSTDLGYISCGCT